MSHISQTSRPGGSRVSTSKVSITRTMPAPSTRPGPSGIRRPSIQPVASSSMKENQSSMTGAIPKVASQQKEFTLPAFSTIRPAVTKGESEFEKMKKKNIRRVVAEGENPKMIKEILKAVRDQDILVQEFVAKIGPHTGDNGDCLRKVMADELASFRKLAVKVYDTMTQDVNDVLTNEHAELCEFYREKIEYYSNKMMRCIDEIYDICPNFDFDRYYSPEREEYLLSEFPVPDENDVDPEELEMFKRQEMYHRLQWLRTEGERFAEENKMLQKRLAELKRQQREGLRAANDAIQQAEQKKKQLEQTEAEMEQQLEVLNESMEKSIIEHERSHTESARSKASMIQKKTTKKKPAQRPEWNVGAATEIEGTSLQQAVQAEVSTVSMSLSKNATKKKGGKSKSKRPASANQSEAFHYSPIKTPPAAQGGQKVTSPFHYSPPPDVQNEPPPPTQTTRKETTTVETARLPPRLGRRAATAPKDSWGGFG